MPVPRTISRVQESPLMLLGFRFRVLLGHRCAAAELDAAPVIDPQDLDPRFIAELQYVFHLVDAMVGDFADMQEAIPVGHDLDESAEFFDTNDLATVNLADFDFRGDRLDLLNGPIG